MATKDTKLEFNLNTGVKVEVMIRATEDAVCILRKCTFSHPECNGGKPHCDYTSGEYYLDSFDDTHHNEYPIEVVMESCMTDKPIPGTETFWSHP